MIVEGIDKVKEQEEKVADQTHQTHKVHRKGIINPFERDYKLLDNEASWAKLQEIADDPKSPKMARCATYLHGNT